MAELKIRVGRRDSFFDRAHGIARRLDAGERGLQEFHHGFEQVDAVFSVLPPMRWRLLDALRSHGSWSIRGLAQALGRDYKAVHTDVTKLIEVGLIERDEAGRISVPWTGITVELGGSGVEAA